MTSRPLVLIADDHPLVRDAWAHTLRAAFDVAGLRHADSWAAVQQQLADGAVDLALIDLQMPGMQGLNSIAALCQAHPRVAFLVASGEEAPSTVQAALQLGARGYLPKSEPPERLVQALRLVRAGGCYLPAAAAAAPWVAPPTSGFTPRQLDVLRGLLRGLPNKLIARELGLSEGTVKIHVTALLRGLRARNRTEALLRARELGLDGPAPTP